MNTKIISAIVIIAAMATVVPALVGSAYAQNSNSITASITQNGQATGGSSVFGRGGDAEVEQGFCFQANQNAASVFGNAANGATNSISKSDCS